ncbi:MAG TPA: DNA polymerase III subunit delta [Vicinamibacteria bacterium]|nr:DNA polymerase III subunit delta [Vicinamibacteria bacterium]
MGSRVASVHLIVGGDSWLADQALEAALQAAVGAERGDSVQVFRGDETSWTRVMEAARTGSLFAPRRAVVVRQADAIKGEGEEVLAWLADPDPDTALVLLAVKPDKRRTLWKKLVEKCSLLSAEPPKGRALRGYVLEQLRRRKVALSDEGVEELLERVGQDLRRLMGELEKLAAFAAERKAPLSGEEVAAVLGKGLAQPLYKLADAMAARRAGRVLELLEKALDDGEPALKVLGTLHRALRQVRGARDLREARATREQVIARLGLLPFKVGDVLEASRAWTDAELVRAIAALERADRRIKSGTDGRLALSAAVAEACGGGKGAAAVRPAARPGR